MAVFENFPYTNFHNLNLDWVLNKLKSFEERLNKIEKGRYTSPSLSTVSVDWKFYGKKFAKLALDILKHKKVETIEIPVQIIERESTKRS